MENEYPTATVTCETPDCLNAGQPIAVEIPPGTTVFCGPCGAILAPEDVEA